MASRILANLIVSGGQVLLKAAAAAYQKALVNAQRSGVANEAAKGGAASVFGGRKTMAIEEARSILGVDANASLEDVMARYAKMFEANEKIGSFYLQSKIHRAKERMEADFLGEGGGDGDGDGGDGGGDATEMKNNKNNPNTGQGFAASGVDQNAK